MISHNLPPTLDSFIQSHNVTLGNLRIFELGSANSWLLATTDFYAFDNLGNELNQELARNGNTFNAVSPTLLAPREHSSLPRLYSHTFTLETRLTSRRRQISTNTLTPLTSGHLSRQDLTGSLLHRNTVPSPVPRSYAMDSRSPATSRQACAE